MDGMNIGPFNATDEDTRRELMPARLNSQQTAQALGFAQHDIPILISTKLLKPLGDPAPNAPKYFARVEIEKLAVNPDWLHKATKAVSRAWKAKNQKQRQKPEEHDRQETGCYGDADKCR